jgi:thiol-disulfide isomerase/thioredoxin
MESIIVDASMATELPQPRVRAPELDGGEGWLNTDRPLSVRALRGKVVVLDFWTSCCINCLHVLPDLKRLERKHGDALVVIGVHSAKFTNEGETAHIREAIGRYEIEHPVVNDRGFAIWHAYAVRAWPTVMVIDAEGYVVGGVSGEGHFDVLDEVVSELIEDARRRGILDTRPLARGRAPGPAADGVLAYPGKVVVDEPSARVLIADSNHHRVLVATMDGRVTDVIGCGAAGTADGPLDRAAFNHPQGMAVVEDLVYVADTDNHLIRTVDLAGGVVATLAGTGEQARGLGALSGPALDTPLSSPWDVVVADGVLFVAMAGPHQVWAYDADRRRIGPWAGTGREGRQDGSRWESAFAQPSGITADEGRLYVADSETSSIRAIDRRTDAVETVVGLDLFEFGDVDGVGDEVRLQHPLGVTAWKGLVYVADTYNHKVKVLDPVTRRVATLAGSGHDDVFFEPGGVGVGLGWLWVADTNHHAVKAVDLSTGAVRALALSLP